MMRLVLVQRGRLRDAHVLALRDEFVKRIGRYAKLDVMEHERGAWPAAARWKVLLDERGEALSSPQLAERLARWTAQHGTVAFAVGGADGHHAEYGCQRRHALGAGPGDAAAPPGAPHRRRAALPRCDDHRGASVPPRVRAWCGGSARKTSAAAGGVTDGR